MFDVSSQISSLITRLKGLKHKLFYITDFKVRDDKTFFIKVVPREHFASEFSRWIFRELCASEIHYLAKKKVPLPKVGVLVRHVEDDESFWLMIVFA